MKTSRPADADVRGERPFGGAVVTRTADSTRTFGRTLRLAFRSTADRKSVV